MRLLAFLIIVLLQTIPARARADGPLRIGVIFPFSGKEARQAQLGRTGIELALAEFADFRPQMVFEDSQSNPEKAVAAFGKLQALDGVDVVLTMGSPIVMALLPLANRSKVPVLAMAVVSDFSRPNDFGFRLMGTAQGFGRRISALLQDELGKKRIGLIYADDDYGTAYAGFFEQDLGRKGLLQAAQPYMPGTADFRPLLLRLKAAKADAVILASWGVDVGSQLRQAKELGLAPDVFVCPGACDNPDVAVSGAGATDRLIVVASASATTPEREQILLNRFKEAPTSVVLRFFDALAVLRHAASGCLAKEERRVCLRDAIAAARDVPGSSYAIGFDENGDIIDQYQLKVVRAGKLVAAKDRATPDSDQGKVTGAQK